MANDTKYEWTLPISGKKVTWKPLTVGQRIDLDGNYRTAERAHLKKYAEYSMRLVSMEGMVEKPQIEHLREWEDYDLEAFAGEVAMRELARANALAAQRPGSPIPRLEQAIEAAQLSAQRLGEELQNVLLAAKATEQQLGPLKSNP